LGGMVPARKQLSARLFNPRTQSLSADFFASVRTAINKEVPTGIGIGTLVLRSIGERRNPLKQRPF
ncbi:MAG TPA: hypothetical protein PKO33_17385, partial [Pyrinomonadaceae bacterium]|nr:hypothetical protein [Pyrinomonadaceae bacterium]